MKPANGQFVTACTPLALWARSITHIIPSSLYHHRHRNNFDFHVPSLPSLKGLALLQNSGACSGHSTFILCPYTFSFGPFSFVYTHFDFCLISFCHPLFIFVAPSAFICPLFLTFLFIAFYTFLLISNISYVVSLCLPISSLYFRALSSTPCRVVQAVKCLTSFLNALGSILAGTSAVLAEICDGFPQPLQTNVGIVP
jgi:hypothetical protein